MSVIKLKRLALENFKGIKNLTIDFENITNIYGDNKLGKSTIFDGFTWLLFDKDSKDRSKFEVQPLDKENNVVHMLETGVLGVLEVDGKTIELKKILKEKYVKRRGEVNSDFKGTETLYYINEIPVKLSEYKEKINSIIDEKLFKLISNPRYFSLNMKWEDRRTVILDIVGDITTERIINYNDSLKPLINLLKDMDLDTFKKTILTRIKKLKDDKTSIPYRVDELNNSISKVDFDATIFRKRVILEILESVEKSLICSSELSNGLLGEKNKLYELKANLNKLEFKLNEENQKPLKQLKVDLRATLDEIYKLENEAYRINLNIESNKIKGLDLEADLQALRDKWQCISEEELEISENEYCCPTCKRAFEAEDIEAKKREMVDNFNKNKDKRLKEINSVGEAKKELLQNLKVQIQNGEVELEALNFKLDKLKSSKEEKEIVLGNLNLVVDLSENAEYQKLKLEIEKLEIKVLKPIDDSQNILELKGKKEKLELELEEINSILGFKEQNIKTKARINELLKEERNLAEKIAELEGQEFLCEKYIKTKVELLESGINSKFKFVRFKLFNALVNGAVEECCEALIDGVPFSNTNTASQINAGIDIINALCEYYKISAPVFIDNRESINEILDCNSQIINLIVSRDKKLVIENANSTLNINTNINTNTNTNANANTNTNAEKSKQGPSF